MYQIGIKTVDFCCHSSFFACSQFVILCNEKCLLSNHLLLWMHQLKPRQFKMKLKMYCFIIELLFKKQVNCKLLRSFPPFPTFQITHLKKKEWYSTHSEIIEDMHSTLNHKLSNLDQWSKALQFCIAIMPTNATSFITFGLCNFRHEFRANESQGLILPKSIAFCWACGGIREFT